MLTGNEIRSREEAVKRLQLFCAAGTNQKNLFAPSLSVFLGEAVHYSNFNEEYFHYRKTCRRKMEYHPSSGEEIIRNFESG